MKEMYRKTPSLIEIVVTRENLEAAVQSVMRNKGAAGIDGMTVFEVEEHINECYIPLPNKLLDGSYKPKPVQRVEIPKPSGRVCLRKILNRRVLEPFVRWCERPTSQLMASPLLDRSKYWIGYTLLDIKDKVYTE